MKYLLCEWRTMYDGRDGICGSKGIVISRHDTYDDAKAARIVLDEEIGGDYDSRSEINTVDENGFWQPVYEPRSATAMLDDLVPSCEIPF